MVSHAPGASKSRFEIKRCQWILHIYIVLKETESYSYDIAIVENTWRFVQWHWLLPVFGMAGASPASQRAMWDEEELLQMQVLYMG